MKKPRTLTRTAASILMIPVLYIAVTGLLYGILAISLSDPVLDWMVQANLDLLPDLIYVILVCMSPVLPVVVLGSSAVGIILQIVQFAVDGRVIVQLAAHGIDAQLPLALDDGQPVGHGGDDVLPAAICHHVL